METQQQQEEEQQPSVEDQNGTIHDNPSIDTSRPFRSVKEAVAAFGERLLANGIQHSQRSFTLPKQETPRKQSSQSLVLVPPSNAMQQASRDDNRNNHELALTGMLKKLEAELQDTKRELNVLKERESETEIALASLNAELHKNMSKMAEAEAAAAAKAVATRSAMVVAGGGSGGGSSDVGGDKHRKDHELMKRRESIVRMDQKSSLAQLLSIGEKELVRLSAMKKEKKKMKKKPIIPLIGDIFSKKKSSSTTLHNPLFAASQMYFS